MTINIQYLHMETSESMDNYVTERLKKLYKKYSWIINAEVHFGVEHNAKEKGKICKIELSAPGPRIFASSDDDNYEDAVKRTIKDLEIQLKKRKEVFKTY